MKFTLTLESDRIEFLISGYRYKIQCFDVYLQPDMTHFIEQDKEKLVER